MIIVKEKLGQIILNSEFEALIGQVENEWFECKGQPYPLEKDFGKRELAKDVSALANHEGGFLLIGVTTQKSKTSFGDVVRKIGGVASNLVDTIQYHNVIEEWIYPVVEAVKVQWMPTKSDSKKGVLVISIPAQDLALKPFLITRVLDEKGRVEILFGLAQRKRDNNEPLSVIDLQRALRAGFNYENLMEKRFNNIEALMTGLINDRTARSNREEFTRLIEQRIKETLDD